MSVEVSNIARCSSKTNELRDIDSIGCRAWKITIYNWDIDNFKIKVVTFIIYFGRNNILREIDKCKSKNAASVSEVLALLSWSSEGISDLPYCQNKHYSCLKYRPNI